MSKRKTQKTVNRMDEFEIDEISSVDNPAQQSARALIMKAAGDDDLRKRLRLTSVKDGHQHTMEKQEGRTSYDTSKGAEYGHSHPIVINDDGTVTLGMAEGHTHTVIEKRITVTEALAELPGNQSEPANSGGGQNTGEHPMTKTAEEIAAEKEAVEKRIAGLEKNLATATALASLNDVQKAHYGTLSPEAQAEFLSATPDARTASVEKAAGDDPVEYTTLDGVDIRKSAGALTISMAKRLDESETNLRVEKAAREREGFVKRANAELSNLPGNESAQVALLKAVAGIPDAADRTAVGEILTAANSGVSKAFETAGTSAGSTGGAADAEAKLEKMAQELSASSGDSFQKSYRAVLETPAGRELFKQTR